MRKGSDNSSERAYLGKIEGEVGEEEVEQGARTGKWKGRTGTGCWGEENETESGGRTRCSEACLRLLSSPTPPSRADRFTRTLIVFPQTLQ